MNASSRSLAAIGAALALAPAAAAQLDDVFIINDAYDSTLGLAEDQLLRLVDLDGSGDFNGAGEALEFFEFAAPQPGGYYFRALRFALEGGTPVAYWTNNATPSAGITAAEVLRGVDANGDGQLDPSEVTQLVDLNVALTGPHAVFGLAIAADGSVWGSTEYPGGSIFRVSSGTVDVFIDDNTGANYQATSTTGLGLQTVDTDDFSRLTPAGDGVLVYIDGFGDDRTEGVFKYEDKNGNGAFDVDELTPFLIPTDINPAWAPNVDFNQDCSASLPLRNLRVTNTAAGSTGEPPYFVARLDELATMDLGGSESYYFASESSDSGSFSTNECGESLNGLIFRAVDVNLDGDCNDAGEVNLFYNGASDNGGAPDSQFGKVIGIDAVGDTLYVVALTGGITVTALTDLNLDGDAEDAGERQLQIFDSSLLGTAPWDLYLFAGGAAALVDGALADPVAGGVTLIGNGCGDLSGNVPTISASGNLSISNPTFSIQVDGGSPGLPIVEIVGFDTTSWQGIPLPFELTGAGFPGCDLNVSFDLTFTGTADLGGSASFLAPLPNDPALIGVPVGFQAVAIYLNGIVPGGAFTQGLVATIQG